MTNLVGTIGINDQIYFFALSKLLIIMPTIRAPDGLRTYREGPCRHFKGGGNCHQNFIFLLLLIVIVLVLDLQLLSHRITAVKNS